MATAAAAAASISVRPVLQSCFRGIHRAHAHPTLDASLPEAKPLSHLKTVLLLPSISIPRRFLHASASAAAALTETGEEEGGGGGAAAGEEEQPQPRPTPTAPGEEGRLYVGNLPYSMTPAQLAEVFSEAGTVDAVEVVYDRVTDRSRGFAFVTMASVEEANEAIRMFDGAQVGGRTVKVNLPEVPRGGEREVVGPRARASSRGYVESPYKVYAGNLGWTVTSQSLKDAFGAHPGLLGAKVIYDRDSGRSRGFGFVTFTSAEEAQAAIEAMNGVEIEGRPLRLSPAQERQPPASPPSQAPDSGTVAEPAGGFPQSSLS